MLAKFRGLREHGKDDIYTGCFDFGAGVHISIQRQLSCKKCAQASNVSVICVIASVIFNPYAEAPR